MSFKRFATIFAMGSLISATAACGSKSSGGSQTSGFFDNNQADASGTQRVDICQNPDQLGHDPTSKDIQSCNGFLLNSSGTDATIQGANGETLAVANGKQVFFFKDQIMQVDDNSETATLNVLVGGQTVSKTVDASSGITGQNWGLLLNSQKQIVVDAGGGGGGGGGSSNKSFTGQIANPFVGGGQGQGQQGGGDGGY